MRNKIVRIKLLNDGGYPFKPGRTFPVIVWGYDLGQFTGIVEVPAEQIEAIGGLTHSLDHSLTFYSYNDGGVIEKEAEILK